MKQRPNRKRQYAHRCASCFHTWYTWKRDEQSRCSRCQASDHDIYVLETERRKQLHRELLLYLVSFSILGIFLLL